MEILHSQVFRITLHITAFVNLQWLTPVLVQQGGHIVLAYKSTCTARPLQYIGLPKIREKVAVKQLGSRTIHNTMIVSLLYSLTVRFTCGFCAIKIFIASLLIFIACSLHALRSQVKFEHNDYVDLSSKDQHTAHLLDSLATQSQLSLCLHVYQLWKELQYTISTETSFYCCRAP